MQKRVALAATALLLGAQFALVQNSRGSERPPAGPSAVGAPSGPAAARPSGAPVLEGAPVRVRATPR